MTKVSKSPERYTFQAQSTLKKLEEDPTNESAISMLKMYQSWKDDADAKTLDTEWQKNNLEYELRTCEWILTKVRESDKYAQNLYAAMCNMQFQKLDVLPILKNDLWSCSWRHSGGIIADMRQQGDYIDWYCSGIGGGLGNGDENGDRGYVPEGTVTEEIKIDLNKLGWVPVEWPDDKN
jgi:hypothetical protein